MADFSVTWDSKSLAVIRSEAVERAVFRALKKAGGDALRRLRTEAKRQTRARVAIRAGYLANTALPLRFATGRGVAELEWVMRVSGRETPLGEYPRRQTKKGVSVEVQRGKRTLIKRAFLARSKSGRLSVFLRPSRLRYPMGHRLGMSVADSMSDGRVPTLALAAAGQVLGTSFERLFPLELKKRGLTV
jgi:hypothetical protein